MYQRPEAAGDFVPLEATATSCVRPVDPSSVKSALVRAGRGRAGGLRLAQPLAEDERTGRGSTSPSSAGVTVSSTGLSPFAQSRCVLSRGGDARTACPMTGYNLPRFGLRMADGSTTRRRKSHESDPRPLTVVVPGTTGRMRRITGRVVLEPSRSGPLAPGLTTPARRSSCREPRLAVGIPMPTTAGLCVSLSRSQRRSGH